nr:Chain C, PEPTIDE [Gallus gallus]4CW1_F Chain F, PEPTIDE [Gallus gallus]
SWFRKPMTR